MTLNKLASLIAKREGRKHEASIGDIREILKIIVTMEAEDLASSGPDMTDSPIIALSESSLAIRAKQRARKDTKKVATK